MKRTPSHPALPQQKTPTGIPGFDEITQGGLPRGRTTLLVGGPGSGKTVMALQFLVHGAREQGEPGVFVAFEETSSRLIANTRTFGWDLSGREKGVSFIDAQPAPDLLLSGGFDLGGMLAALDAQTRARKARRIVFDALDVVLSLLPDSDMRRRELYRLHDWLTSRGLTGILTAKAEGEATASVGPRPFGLMSFMVDCAVILRHTVRDGVSERSLRVQKYRGSGFDEDESPFRISSRGVEVAPARALGTVEAGATHERVGSGVKRLDAMLGGGYYRGASVLITGFAGTGKTTLSGTFAEAACRRGERTAFVSFDSYGPEVVRNLASVSVRLARHVKSGTLRLISARTIAGSADTYLDRIKASAFEHRARCLVIDPMSAWSRPGDRAGIRNVADRLIDWAKAEGITLVCTRLVDEMFTSVEGVAPLQVSTLVDTWIHLSYEVKGGERNRGLSIIKSRGTAHSNQIRELMLSDSGVTLADTYTAGGEALMGTLRWEKESADRAAAKAAESEAAIRHARLASDEAGLVTRFGALRAELAAKQAEIRLVARTMERRGKALEDRRSRTRALRGFDAVRAKGERVP